MHTSRVEKEYLKPRYTTGIADQQYDGLFDGTNLCSDVFFFHQESVAEDNCLCHFVLRCNLNSPCKLFVFRSPDI